tara:strand:- start:1 stop:447 length:447 start_codon:yes stop_codon:yes gene_type:complete
LSLQNTHERICLAQKEDPFILEYMNLIGHREFGFNQKPFNYGINRSLTKSIFDSKDKVNYWLISWINAYSWLYDFAKVNKTNNLIIVSYEDICDKKSKKLDNIFKISNLKKYKKFILKNKNVINKNNFDDNLKSKAYELYTKIRNLYL